MKFENKVVVITGAGSGIDWACAAEFAKEGARVVIADINLKAAEETVQLIKTSAVSPYEIRSAAN